jgi:hypothetical protein
MVVITIIVQKTLPIPAHIASPPSLQGTKLSWMPNIPKMKNTMNSRKPKVRTNLGIGRWGEYLDNNRSYILPRGHTCPHHQRPLKMLVTTGPIMQMIANRPITGKNQPRIIYAIMIQ